MCEDIQPCPFCGSKRLSNRIHNWKWRIVCEECHVTGPSSHFKNKDVAIRKWNKRATSKSAQREVKLTDTDKDYPLTYTCLEIHDKTKTVIAEDITLDILERIEKLYFKMISVASDVSYRIGSKKHEQFSEQFSKQLLDVSKVVYNWSKYFKEMEND